MVRGEVIKLQMSAKMNADVKIYKISYILVCSKPKILIRSLQKMCFHESYRVFLCCLHMLFGA